MRIPVLRVRDENGNVVEIQILKGADYVLTETDKQEIVQKVIAAQLTETWTFTLEDGSTVNKTVVLK